MRLSVDFMTALIQVRRFLFSRTRLPAQHVSQNRLNSS